MSDQDDSRSALRASLLRLLAQSEPSQRSRAAGEFLSDLDAYLDARDKRVAEYAAEKARLFVEESQKLGSRLQNGVKELLNGKR